MMTRTQVNIQYMRYYSQNLKFLNTSAVQKYIQGECICLVETYK
jgi:hypothetical protein